MTRSPQREGSIRRSTTDLLAEIRRLRRLAASDDWSVREEAGFRLRDMMEVDFDSVFAATEAWVHDSSERVRRAVCLACMQRKASATPARVKRVLQRLAAIMHDDSLYVRKCCGPFVVGYLGYTYPDLVLPWLRGQASSADVNVRANVAKAFTQALGGRHPDAALTTLQCLAEDTEPRVRAAVLAALRNLVRRGVATSVAATGVLASVREHVST